MLLYDNHLKIFLKKSESEKRYVHNLICVKSKWYFKKIVFYNALSKKFLSRNVFKQRKVILLNDSLLPAIATFVPLYRNDRAVSCLGFPYKPLQYSIILLSYERLYLQRYVFRIAIFFCQVLSLLRRTLLL